MTRLEDMTLDELTTNLVSIGAALYADGTDADVTIEVYRNRKTPFPHGGGAFSANQYWCASIRLDGCPDTSADAVGETVSQACGRLLSSMRELVDQKILLLNAAAARLDMSAS